LVSELDERQYDQFDCGIILVIPIFYAWDGQASMPRNYTSEDLDEIIGDNKREDYIWTKGPVFNNKNKKVGMHLYGLPVKST